MHMSVDNPITVLRDTKQSIIVLKV